MHPASVILLLLLAGSGNCAKEYFGKKIGSLKSYQHGVKGDVYAVDAKTLLIRGFSYDGQGPDAFFWGGNSAQPDPQGFIIPDEQGTNNVLKAYNNRDITIQLPEGKTLNDIKWLSVWCRTFTANFGDINIPANLDAPRPRRLERISGVMHNTSSGPVVVVDAQTFMIPNFYTDGQAPDAHFWTGTGPKPHAGGILVPDENGSDRPLGRYDGQSVVITLPGDLTVFDIDWLSVWCRAFTVDFGHVKIPKDLNVPPSLRMLGTSPQSKLNCEVLSPENSLEVRWAKAGESVVVQLVGRVEDGEYISFGLSGDDSRTLMVGGDVVLAWIDRQGAGHAIDYYLDAKAQCAGGRGTCPDYNLQPNTNTVRLLNAAKINGYTMVTYQRPLAAIDRLDKPIVPDRLQAVIWAIGPLNEQSEASYHSKRNKDDIYLEFGRNPQWNCPTPQSDGQETSASTPAASFASGDGSQGAVAITESPQTRDPPRRRPPQPGPVEQQPTRGGGGQRRPQTQSQPQNPVAAPAVTPAPVEVNPDETWFIPPIECPEPTDNVFYAQIGPAGGKKGYSAITGHIGWGIAWYINGLLIPELTVVRGRTYTFVVEGGNDPEAPARNHPFYVTDDPVGGYGTKTLEERKKVRVYAGVDTTRSGEPKPTAGRLCEWFQTSREPAENYSSFGEYQRVLELRCEKGQPAVLQWTPDHNTPNEVYYQCYTHRYLGWRIHVVDRCDFDPHHFGSSIQRESHVDAPPHIRAQYERYGEEQSTRVRHSVKPATEQRFPFPDYDEEYDGHHHTAVRRSFASEVEPELSRSGFHDTEAFPIRTEILNGFKANPNGNPLVKAPVQNLPTSPAPSGGNRSIAVARPGPVVPFQPAFQPSKLQPGGFQPGPNRAVPINMVPPQILQQQQPPTQGPGRGIALPPEIPMSVDRKLPAVRKSSLKDNEESRPPIIVVAPIVEKPPSPAKEATVVIADNKVRVFESGTGRFIENATQESEAYNILTNVWTIIDAEKEVEKELRMAEMYRRNFLKEQQQRRRNRRETGEPEPQPEHHSHAKENPSQSEKSQTNGSSSPLKATAAILLSVVLYLAV